ncbi:MAG: sugar phosphate isomerase/epimerase family protein [Nitrospinota bacterium]
MGFSLSAHLFAREPLEEEHLGQAAAAGFRRLELWAMRPHLDYRSKRVVAGLASWLAKNGLSAPTLHLPFYAHLEEARAGRWLSLAHPDEGERRRALEECRRALVALTPLGPWVAILHPSRPRSSDDRVALRESLESLLPLTEGLGVRLALENIPAPGGDTASVAEVIREVGAPGLGACLDAGHAHLTDDPVEGLGRVAPFLLATHLHDNDGREDAHLVPGGGRIPWGRFREALSLSGYRGPLTVETRRMPSEDYEKALARAWASRRHLGEGAEP